MSRMRHVSEIDTSTLIRRVVAQVRIAMSRRRYGESFLQVALHSFTHRRVHKGHIPFDCHVPRKV